MEQECSLIIQKQNKQQNMAQRESLTKEEYIILFKTIANTSFYHKLAQKYGDSFAKISLKHLKYETYQKGDLIIKQGSNCLNTYFVLSGIIEVDMVDQYDQSKVQEKNHNYIQEKGLQNTQMISIGASFGYLPSEVVSSEQTFKAFSNIVELAVIDLNSLREVHNQSETLTNCEKIKFFQEQMSQLFHGIDKKSVQLFMQLIKEAHIKRGETVSSKLNQPNSVCIISKGQIMSDYSIEMERERLKDDGIDISDKREIKRRHYSTQILVRGDVFVVNGKGDSSKNIIGTHMKIKEKLVGTTFITQIYYLDDQEYENILKKLRNDMRFEILVEDDNLKFSQKILNDFIEMHQRFIEKQKDLKRQVVVSQECPITTSDLKQDKCDVSHSEQDDEFNYQKKHTTIDQTNNSSIRENDTLKNMIYNTRKDLQTSYQFQRQRRNTINIPSAHGSNNNSNNNNSYNCTSTKKDFSYNVANKVEFEYSAISYYFDKQDILQKNKILNISNHFKTYSNVPTEPNASYLDSLLQNSTYYPQKTGRKVVVVNPTTINEIQQNNPQKIKRRMTKESMPQNDQSRCEYIQTEYNQTQYHATKREQQPQSCKNSSTIVPQKDIYNQQQVLNQLPQQGNKVQNLFQLQQQISSKRNRAVSQFVTNLTSDYGHIPTESHEEIQFANSATKQFLKRRNTNNSLSATKKIRYSSKNASLLCESGQNSSNKKSYNLYGQFDDELENLLKCKNQILKKCKKDQKEFDRSSEQMLKTYESQDADYLSVKKKQILDQANKEVIKKRIEEKENMHHNKKIYKKADNLRVSLFGDMSDVIRARVSRMFKNHQNPLANSYI